ncbi:hypothetical protein Tcan_04173 [Toxocara canis]|uniref:Uncharacterized protein n=1 Tax=Toxocara canis TaxID=6265 RepID=A0A0B2VV30_TOXCA|nr:hypothetical protein Tcan_04173 [Toxocara canis]
MPLTLINNFVMLLLFVIVLRRTIAKLTSEKIVNKTDRNEINSTIAAKNISDLFSDDNRSSKAMGLGTIGELINGMDRIQETKTTLLTPIRKTVIKQRKRIENRQSVKILLIIFGIVGGILLLVIIVIIILWCSVTNRFHQIRKLWTKSAPSTIVKNPNNQSKSPKSMKALQKQEAPLTANAAKSLTKLNCDLLEEQPTQAETSNKKSTQSSSRPISPVSKTVFDEDEPCVNPKKVKYLGNLDQVLKDRITNYKEEIINALMEDEMEDLTQNDSQSVARSLRAKFRDERCILYVTDDIPTEDDVIDNNGNDTL